MKIKRINNKGFTIIELMIASTVFSVVLLLCTFGLIQIGRVYYKGVVSTRTQETARNIIDAISQNIQFGDYATIGDTGQAKGFCAGDRRFSYLPDSTGPWQRTRVNNLSAKQSVNVLVVDKSPGVCGPSAQPLTSGSLAADSQELLGEGMWLSYLRIASIGNSLYDVEVTVASGAADDLNSSKTQCISGAGSQFCAVSSLSTTVQKRVE